MYGLYDDMICISTDVSSLGIERTSLANQVGDVLFVRVASYPFHTLGDGNSSHFSMDIAFATLTAEGVAMTRHRT